MNDTRDTSDTAAARKPGRRLLSVCIPVFNEEDNVARIVPAVDAALESHADRYELEFVFTDNCSTDRTFERLQEIAAADNRVRVLRFSRNFGFQKSILTGLLAARGHCAVQLDADLQDPPALIAAFLERWEAGIEVVYGVRRGRKEGRLITGLRKLFYRALNLLAEHPVPVDTGDFRLIDRKIIEVLREAPASDPYLRGEIARMGFRQEGVPYDRDARKHGRSKFSLRALMGLAVDGIISQSIVPLRVATWIGLIMSVVTFGALIFYTVVRLFFVVDWPPGFATTTVLILLSISLNALFLGIIGEYLARIYRQVNSHHQVIVARRIGFDRDSDDGPGDTGADRDPGA